jgi:dienelactone hydrolase
MFSAWSIPGSDGLPIIGDCHPPEGEAPPRGVVIIAHGFKGYKDYGMFPRIAGACARGGFIAHRFNFSHSGMTNRIETFEQPDLFEKDTWNRQVFDLRCVIEAAARGELSGRGLPYVVFGHSRGGATALLAAGLLADEPTFPQPACIITAAAPSYCNPFSQEESNLLLRQGWIESPSSRTGQKLRVGRAFLQEQLDDPEAHNVLAMTRRIRCPLLVVHGDADPTVPVTCGEQIAAAAGDRGELLVIPAADHVFNTPNPLPASAEPSRQLSALLKAMMEFLHSNG